MNVPEIKPSSFEVPYNCLFRNNNTNNNNNNNNNCKTRPENEATTNHSWTASPKDRCRSLVCPQKTVRKGPEAGRSSPCGGNYRTGGICRQEGRPTNTGCQNTPTQYRLSSVTDS